jgi:LuxR family transcriptional regulator, maltose regulon positive regulatory protein
MNDLLVSKEHVLQKAPLLATKLHIPSQGSNLVPRPHLLAQLDVGMKRKLTLISAPAGAGKTTLLCEWLQSPAGHNTPLAWLSLDTDDNDLIRFWSYVCTALEQLYPGVGEQALALLHSPHPPIIEFVLTTLINALASISTHFTFVLDDYHVITTSRIHHTLAFLLEHMPSEMHITVTSRTDAPFPLARLRAHGQIIEIHAGDLRFTPLEIAVFLWQVMKVDLTTEEIATIEARTEGWITGLQMLALSTKGREPVNIAQLLSIFKGNQRSIFDYLAHEVLLQQPAYIQHFLLETCILDRLSGSLCDAVTGGTTSQMLLVQLEQLNLFLLPLDKEQQWYRYHHLFAEFLRSRMKAQQRQDTTEGTLTVLHSRASFWYERHYMLTEAVAHALASEDFDRAVYLIEQVKDQMFAHGQLVILLRWLALLPETTLRCHSRLCLYAAQIHLFKHQFEVAEMHLLDAERILVEHGEVITPAERRILQGEMMAICAALNYLREDMSTASELCHEALRLLPNDHTLRGLVLLTLGSIYWLDGDAASASATLTEAQEVCQETNNIYMLYIVMSHLARVKVLEGNLSEAMKLYSEALEIAVEHGGELTGSGLYVGMGALLYEQNDLEEATHHLNHGIDLAQKQEDALVLIGGKMTLARTLQAQGSGESANELMSQAVRLTKKQGITWTWVAASICAYQARFWVTQGNLVTAEQWVKGNRSSAINNGSELSRPMYLCEVEEITWAQIYLAQGKHDEALKMLVQLHETAEVSGRIGHVLEILVLEALVYQAKGDTSQALSMLEQALKLAEPEGYVRLFADKGAPMETLLVKVRATSIGLTGYIDSLLMAFPQQQKNSTSPLTVHDKLQKTAQPLIEPLSERELEVLRLLVRNMSNQEIAEQLVISINTVKQHVKNIFSKLDVHSRVQAVVKAEALQIF